MEILTKYPVLVDPAAEQKDKFRLAPNAAGLPGDVQTVSVGDFTIKGTTPVFEGNNEVSRNEFMYATQVKNKSNVLTPMDEWLYSERNISDGALGFGEFENWGDVFSNVTGEERRARRQGRKAARKTTATMQEIKDKIVDIPGGPSKAEQEAKLNEGKFWNTVKGGWDNFSKSSSGQILIDSITNYLSTRLGGGSPYQDTSGGPTPDQTPAPTEDQPMSKTTKYVLIGGAIVVVGLIVYSLFKASKNK